ncbi:hypothetical protein EI969_27060 [Pseudomonas sp. PB101]|jgi:predicted acetyltransferase|uniref:hypothetical protein n=1 Tax=Pseudomonas sp. PB101 TaxID=2495428 RepID=UPI001365C444|nr:hypothetical protein [Pseudomonas sp. PB101]MVW89548.1 hypothetical protein [Pseudomonas sp. PB101]
MMIGYWLCALLWGVVLLEEIQRMPLQEWKDEGLKKVLLLRRTRNRTGYFMALIAGAMCLYSEILVTPADQNILSPELILAVGGLLWGVYLSVVCMKGKR